MESSKLKNRVGGPVEDESRLSRSSPSFRFLTPETTGSEDHSDGSVSSFLWPNFLSSNDHTTQSAQCFSSNCADNFEETSEEKDGSSTSGSVDDLAEMEMEMVKERLSKLLLGEDMSGSGNGVSTALAISNAITNLCASVFGQLWRLEPLPQIKKYMWKREMECLLCVTDYIAELKPSWHAYPDGSKIEVMSRIPRADLSLNLPALRKLDNMLLAILDCFNDTEFWYVEHGLASADLNVLSSFRKGLKRQEEKWWMPVPQVPPCGLSHETRKKLQKQRECSNQILKAVAATNSITLADMEIPKSYLDGLPKTGKACLGDIMYRNLTSQNFSSNSLLAGLGISSEHKALEIANQVEAAIFVWRKRTNSKDIKRSNQRSSSRDSWEMVKDFVQDTEKKELLADRAECFLLCLKQQFPGLSQTMLDASKIQYNKDVGKSILESYSRVLESLAFNIVALIDDILYVDDMNKQSGQKKKFLTQRFAHLVTEPNRRTTPEFSFQK